MDDYQFLTEVIVPKLNEEDCPAWADRVEEIAARLYKDDRERKKKAAHERLRRHRGETT